MNLHSIKTRLVGSYSFLLLLFLIQLPIVYVLVGSMSERYTQVDTSGGLRKRAVEIVSILYQHIVSGDETLEKTFQEKKDEYGRLIEDFKNGSKGLSAIKDKKALDKLENVSAQWRSMRSALDEAMESGDRMHESVDELEKTTPQIQGKLDELARTSAGRAAEQINALRTKTLRTSYLVEHYIRTNEAESGSNELARNTAEIDSAMKALYGPLHGQKAFSGLEKAWNTRKALVLAAVQSQDAFRARIKGLTETNAPGLVAAADELTKQISEDARKTAAMTMAAIGVSILLSAVLVAGALWATKTQIITPVIRIKETVEDFAKGDLTRRAGTKIKFMGMEFKDEISGLGGSIDDMASQMSEMIGKIKVSSGHLASASGQLVESSTKITEGADRQSGQTAHMATAMEEMSAAVVEVARSSQQATVSAREAQTIAQNGGHVVSRAIEAMREVAESTSVTGETIKRLGKSSEEIGTIISVINDIADQTNLLALNAAIEAARAGEQGRGFAVVADEVRKLAERTTRSTKEIGTMIKTIQTEASKAVNATEEGTAKVEKGVKYANEAGEALLKIVTGVENVTDMISHIATSAEEQSATTEAITQNMDNIAEVAKANVEAVDRVAKATDELAQLASDLQKLVVKFKVINSEKGAPGEEAVKPAAQLYLVKAGEDAKNQVKEASGGRG